jgi:hypothetical protein
LIPWHSQQNWEIMSRNLLVIVATFFILAIIQILLLKYFVLFGVGFCFLYLLALLLLPIEISFISAMVLGLLLGLTVDLFYNTIGIHAAASVFVMFIRPYWMSANKPRSGYEMTDLPMIANYGLAWFITYSFPLIAIHAFTVFMLESGGQLVGLSVVKMLATSVISLVFMLAIQYLFYSKSK